MTTRNPSKRNPWAIGPLAVEQVQICIRAADMCARGTSYATIAAELGLGSPLEAKKCAERGYGLAPGEDHRMARRKAASELDLLRRETWKILEDPGYATTVSGKMIIDPATKQPVEDRQVKIAAINTLRAINSEYRKLYGTDAPRQTVNVNATAPLEELQAAVARMRQEVEEAEAEALREAQGGGDDDWPPALPPGVA